MKLRAFPPLVLLLGALLLCIGTLLPAADHTLKVTPQTIAWGYYWSAAKPVLSIRSGDTVEIQTVSGNPEQLERSGLPPDQVPPALRTVYRDIPKDQRGPGRHLLTGPVRMEGAEPGDVLEVRIRDIRMDVPFAYNTFRKGAGFLPDEFEGTQTKIIHLDRVRKVGSFAAGIELPLKPFFGSMGVAPPEAAGKVDSAPPGIHAGNLDNKELVSGTTLFIPVQAHGALFEVGDGHAGMGNGEVDITALETSLTGVFQFILRKDLHLKWPRAETPTHWITMGLDPDLTEATKIAVHETLDFLMHEKKLTREQAYMLASVAVDFEITQLVDGTKGVHGMIPKSIFKKSN
jgi:acetamidase/formamidase